MFAIVKILISAIIIGVITEFSRRYPQQGGIIAALPIVSLLSILWLYTQGEQMDKIGKFAIGVVWGLPGTVVMLLIIGIALKHSIHLLASFGLGIAGWLIFYFVQDLIVKHMNSL
ncbi:DUF3147 family protein [Neobacillus vireti]|uniref:DUF3147 family protein n=1 Tax=Neobacillus vireti LMG 21834 TaxID=1131730 RepID=A0AB94IFU6_9BACI|nr:DUF3147 family protein [Neobacillus vireti]ETI65984.1 hypothetical protein BAVI_24928 [Neobacillus vireti LMG 21834]KLT17514.1 membrane protein [Neobacillus vireti]